jgi:hypothetical protein
MGRPRRFGVWIAGAAILLIGLIIAGADVWPAMKGHAHQACRERIVRDVGTGALVPAPHGKLPFSKATASECGCVEAFAKGAPNGFFAVVFVDARYKNANFLGRLYVNAPLDSPLANGSKLVYGRTIDVGADQGVYIGDKIDANWYQAYYDQD